MLDPRFFLIRSFGLASLVVTVAFGVMFGQFFLIAQYFQLVLGQSALESGLRTLPFAVTMVAIAPRAPRLAARFGPRNILVTGLLIQAVGLVVLSRAGVDSSYSMVVPGIVFLAGGMGMIMPTLTAVIVSSLPQEKAGVASAVNDTTREVGGAMGIAIMGSLMATGYRQTVEPVASVLPEGARELASDSIGAALAIANQQGGEGGRQLAETARQGFIDGMSTAMLAAAATALIIAALIRTLYPDKSE